MVSGVPSSLLEQYLTVQEAKRTSVGSAEPPSAAAWWRAAAPAALPSPPLPAGPGDATPWPGDASAAAASAGALATSHRANSSPTPTADALHRYELLLAEALAQLEADGIAVQFQHLKGPSASVTTCVDTYVPGPPYCTYGLRVPASCRVVLTRGAGQPAPEEGICCTYDVHVPASGVP